MPDLLGHDGKTMKNIYHIISIILLAVLSGCALDDLGYDMSEEYPGLAHRSFSESMKSFANPERGFDSSRNWHSASDPLLKDSFVNLQRVQGRTVLYTGYYLTDYMESDISQDFLDLIDANMRVLRKGGVKCVLRFAYKTDMYETGHPWDTTPEWVHRHIEQLKPVLQRNKDVILCLQAGFIGVWGEWGYTDGFLSSPKTPEDFATRRDVVKALLDALPEERQIAVRTGRYKMNMFLDSYADSVTIETAYNGSDLSRICGHNDCFGADASDMGTFTKNAEREFWKKESRYLMMGGETCQISEYCLCDRSVKDCEDYHWTYMSGPANISNRWKEHGCYDEIERRLGYRITLTDLHYDPDPVPGRNYRLILELKNTGFAAPMNPRDVELVFVDGDGDKKVYRLDDIDPRYWFAGQQITIDRTIRIPEDAEGDCALYLNLPDPEFALRNNPLFSIRLANAEYMWDETTGYNQLITLKL